MAEADSSASLLNDIKKNKQQQVVFRPRHFVLYWKDWYFAWKAHFAIPKR